MSFGRAAVAILIGSASIACGAGSPGPSRSPVAGSVSPSPNGTFVPVAKLGRCHAARLRATIHGSEGATGHSADTVVVFNRGHRPCAIPSRARLELRDAQGNVVALSGRRKPFASFALEANEAVVGLDARSSADDWSDPPRVRRVALTMIAQGPCPGGVFPDGGTLWLIFPNVGPVRIGGFEDALPFDYRCDEGQSPPSGKPELLIGDVVGPADF
jgi:hypothetical protein